MDIEASMNGIAALGARWVLWLLVALSVAGVAIVIERCVFLVSTRDSLALLRKVVFEALGQGQLARARQRLEELPSVEARVLHAGLGARSAPEAAERMAAEAALQKLRMEERLAFLGTLGNNAPFVGLLGTVIGIVGALRELDAAGGRISEGLMREIGEALIATAVGLMVALPAVVAFNAFQRVIKVRLARSDALGRELCAHLVALDSQNAGAEVADAASVQGVA